MSKQIVVVGLGRFGVTVATTLSRLGHEVLAVDKNMEIVQNVATQVTHAVQADSSHEAALKELGIGNFDIAVVAIGSDTQSNVLVTILLKRLGIPYVIARANNELHGEILEKIGADKVVFPEAEMGESIGHEAILGNIDDYMPIVAGYGIAKIKVIGGLAGKSLFDLGLGPLGEFRIAVLLIQRGEEVIVTPTPDERVATGDIIVISGSDDKIGEFMAKIGKTKRGR